MLIDTLRADYLGCYGFDGPVSPNVDGLARESFLFDRCYAPAPWTKPSIASLFTSLYPVEHGVTNHDGNMWGGDAPDLQKGVLRDEAETLAERLRAAGYRTGAFVANPWLTADYGFGQGFEIYNDSSVTAHADTVLENARRWLTTVGPDEPFFLYVHLMEVHAPYNASEAVHELVRNSPGVQTDIVIPREHWGRIPKSLLGSRWVEDESGNKKPEIIKLTTWLGRYAAGMRDLDDRLGPFFTALERDERLANAYVIVTSDHGEELYDHGYWEHGYTLFEEQIHVPLIIRPPGGLSSGREITSVVGLVDLFPTLLGLAGQAPGPVVGKDLSPFFAGDGPGGSGIVLASAARTNPGLVALCAGRYKLILYQDVKRLALYDVVADPRETKNLAQEKPELVAEMRRYLEELIAAEKGRKLFETASQPMPEERIEELKSLGYMN